MHLDQKHKELLEHDILKEISKLVISSTTSEDVRLKSSNLIYRETLLFSNLSRKDM